MKFNFTDILIIIVYVVITLLIGLYFRKKGSKGLNDYFLGGRNLPWYLAGLSMVATTFAADTPLLITELVTTNGISGNWLWWNMLIGGMLTVFFFSRLWHRSNVLTELEFIELRYEGRSGALLRGFKAIYLGLFMNVLIIGWVNLALKSILEVFFDIPQVQILWFVFGAMLIAAVYSTISGLWGITFTDAVQFVMAMTGSIVLAVFVVSSDKIGGLTGLHDKITHISSDYLSFFPSINNSGSSNGIIYSITFISFIAFIGIQWWASWYPGAEPGGGGYVAQRMMSTKNEKHSLLATLFFQVAHYALRPWPWILVGLSTIILYPDLAADAKKTGYVLAIVDFMPHTWAVLMLTALLAAYMSTISTQLNWGSSFLVNDLYKRFIKKENAFDSDKKADSHYVLVGKLTTLLIMLISLFTTMMFNTIKEVWEFLIACGAGLGLVLILRWFWWRINAWSEITATVIPIFILWIIKKNEIIDFPDSLFILVGITTISWLIVTFLTKPVSISHLKSFYNRVRPIGWWGELSAEKSTSDDRKYFISILVCWISSIAFVYSILFCIGYMLFKDFQNMLIWLAVMVVSGIILWYGFKESEKYQ